MYFYKIIIRIDVIILHWYPLLISMRNIISRVTTMKNQWNSFLKRKCSHVVTCWSRGQQQYNFLHISWRLFNFLLRVDRGVFYFHRTIRGRYIHNYPPRMQPHSHPPVCNHGRPPRVLSHIPRPKLFWFQVKWKPWIIGLWGDFSAWMYLGLRVGGEPRTKLISSFKNK